MAIIVNDNIRNNTGKAIDDKGSKIASGKSVPFVSTTEANGAIDSSIRNKIDLIWILVDGINVPHQYKGGIADINLVPLIDVDLVPRQFLSSNFFAGLTDDDTAGDTEENPVVLKNASITDIKLADTSKAFKRNIQLAISDETTALTTGTGKLTFRMPHVMTLTGVRASVGTAPTGSTLVVDINQNGATILSTKLSIDASEKTSVTAVTAAVISTTALTDDAEITIDIDQIGSTVAGAGLKVTLIGTI